MNKTTGLGLLIIRVAFGLIMIAHGLLKFAVGGLPGSQAYLAELGVPAAPIFGVLLPFAEVILGGLVVIGLLTRISALVLAVISVGAIFLVHLQNGFFVTEGGFEFVALLAAVGVGIALTGAGSLAIDSIFSKKRRRGRADRSEPVPVS